MLALEAAFDVEFPDAMLKRSVFQSVSAIAAGARASCRRGRGMSVAVDRDQAFLAGDPPDRRRGRRRRTPTTSTATPASRPRRVDALREAAARSRPSSRGARRRRRLLRGDRRGLLRAGPPLRRERDGLRDAPDPDRCDRPPPRRRALVRGLPPRRRARAAARRVGDLRDRDRRRHGPLDRGGHAGGDGARTFEKQAPTVSYGAYADDLLTTLRRSPDAEPGDQVVVLTRRDQHDARADGHVGSARACAAPARPGYVVRAEFPAEQVLPTPFSRVATESMVPISHILWSHLWLGIATDAFDRARAFVRAVGQAAGRTQLPPTARRACRSS